MSLFAQVLYRRLQPQHNVVETPSTGTIPPTTRKRKAAEATEPSNPGPDVPSNKRVASAAAIEKVAAPPTPVTMTSKSMDSEEDFMSNATSDEEMQDFSDDGQYFLLPPFKHHLLPSVIILTRRRRL